MWIKIENHKFTGTNITLEQIWQVWANVNNWHLWQDDMEFATINGKFEKGRIIRLKLLNGTIIKMELVEAKENKIFTDLTKFFLAKMYVTHEFINSGGSLILRDTFKVTGLLGYFWRKLVFEKVVAGDEDQTKRLIARVLALNEENCGK